MERQGAPIVFHDFFSLFGKPNTAQDTDTSVEDNTNTEPSSTFPFMECRGAPIVFHDFFSISDTRNTGQVADVSVEGTDKKRRLAFSEIENTLLPCAKRRDGSEQASWMKSWSLCDYGMPEIPEADKQPGIAEAAKLCASDQMKVLEMGAQGTEKGSDKEMPQLTENTPPVTKQTLLSKQKEQVQLNYFMCSEYATDILRNYSSAELVKTPRWGYLKELQTDLTPQMRALLVDWMVKLCECYNFGSDTLYLAVHLLDGFLSKRKLGKEKLGALAIACIGIASKYEERRFHSSHLSVRQLYTASDCSKAEVLKMEMQVLSVLGFDISVPTVNTFLRRFLLYAGVSPQLEPMLDLVASYLSELTLLHYDFLYYLPSEIAAAAILLAKWVLDPSSEVWNEKLRAETGYCMSNLQGCAFHIQNLKENLRSGHKAVSRKYQEKLKDRSISIPQLDALFP